jgi:hypothetical protein
LPRVKRHFKNAIVRGDTDFDRADVYQAVIEQGGYFAIGGRVYANRAALAERIVEKRWQRFYPHAEREKRSGRGRLGRTPNYRKNKAQQRGYRTLNTVKQWISEIEYQPAGVPFPCRLIVRRILIEESDGQGVLLKHFRYRWCSAICPALTQLRRSST